MGMRQSFHVRLGVAEDAGRLAVLATQVWLHTYATDGISPEIAAYVLAHLTPAQYAQLLRDASTHVLVALHVHHVVGLAVVRFDTPCPDHPDLAVELQTLYVQEHFQQQPRFDPRRGAATVTVRIPRTNVVNTAAVQYFAQCRNRLLAQDLGRHLAGRTRQARFIYGMRNRYLLRALWTFLGIRSHLQSLIPRRRKMVALV